MSYIQEAENNSVCVSIMYFLIFFAISFGEVVKTR